MAEFAAIPDVSVIIPAYNAAKYIEQCLDSVCAQTIRNIEILVIDDGSTDATPELLSKYAEADQRLTVLSQENLCAGTARNRGLALARGKYLSFLDADDYFEDTMLEQMLTTAENNKADVVICRCSMLNVNTQRVAPADYTVTHLLPNTVYSADDLQEHMFRYSYGWAWDKLFRRDFIQTHNLEFQALQSTNDAYFVFLALIFAQRIVFCDENLLTHRIGDRNSIENSRASTWKNGFAAAEAIEKRMKQAGLFERYEVPFLRWVYTFCLWNFETLEGEAKAGFWHWLQQDWTLRLAVLAGSEDIEPAAQDILAVLKLSHADLMQAYLNDYRLRVAEEEAHRKQALRMAKEHEEALATLRTSYEDSHSYKIGRGFTFLPRKIRALGERKTRANESNYE